MWTKSELWKTCCCNFIWNALGISFGYYVMSSCAQTRYNVCRLVAKNTYKDLHPFKKNDARHVKKQKLVECKSEQGVHTIFQNKYTCIYLLCLLCKKGYLHSQTERSRYFVCKDKVFSSSFWLYNIKAGHHLAMMQCNKI